MQGSQHNQVRWASFCFVAWERCLGVPFTCANTEPFPPSACAVWADADEYMEKLEEQEAK